MPTPTDTPAVPSYSFKDLMAHAERANEPILPPEGYQSTSPVLIVPQGYTAPVLPFVPVRPPRIAAKVRCDSQESFCRYIVAHKTATTTIFAEVGEEDCCFRAVLDYHEESGGAASHCSHQVDFEPMPSENWKRWLAVNRKAMSQHAFAEFIEDNLLDVINPPGAELLQIANTLEINGTLNFSRAQRLQDGTVKFHFVVEQDAKGGGGELKVPETFQLQLAIFDDEPPSVIEARLRYSLDRMNGNIAFRFEIANPHRLVREAFDELRSRVFTGTGLSPYLGVWCK